MLWLFVVFLSLFSALISYCRCFWLRWKHMMINNIFRYQGLGIFYVWIKFQDSRPFQLAIYYIYTHTQFLMRNWNLQSEWTNSFTLKRKLRKINLWESRFLIVKFLIVCLHRILSVFLLSPTVATQDVPGSYWVGRRRMVSRALKTARNRRIRVCCTDLRMP